MKTTRIRWRTTTSKFPTEKQCSNRTLYQVEFEKHDAQKTELEPYEFRGVYLVLWKNKEKVGYVTPQKLELLLGKELWAAFQTGDTIFCINHD